MNIETAVARIIGDKVAHAIITKQSLRWAIVAAMAAAKTPTHDAEVEIIRRWNRENTT